MNMQRFREALRQGCADPHAACCYHKKDSEAPDYQPMADASVQAANISSQLGREQMAQARELHDETMTMSRPLIEAQTRLSEQSIEQGNDYYNYMVSRQRPVEDSLNRDAMGYDGVEDRASRAAILDEQNRTYALNEDARGLITGGDTGVYNARQQDIEESVGRALADSRSGQSAATNQMVRQALRYGWSPEKIAAMAGNQGLAQASQQAAAANGTRQAAIQNARGMMGMDYDMRNANSAFRTSSLMSDRNLQQSDSAREWARRLDVAGLYRGLPNASQGAYGMALGAGNSAIQNQMAPGQAMMGQNQGAMNTIMQGQGQRIQGLGSILGSQTSMAGANAEGNGAMTGAAIGAVATVGVAI